MDFSEEKSSEDAFTRCGRLGLPVTDVPVIDAHCHLGACVGIPIVDQRLETFIATLDRLGIRRVYASGFAAVFGCTRAGNDLVLDAMRRYPDRIGGYMALNPGYPDTLEPEMERCYAAGMRAIKIWSYGMRPGLRYDHPYYRRIFQFAQDRQLPILAHTWAGDEVGQLEAAFRDYDRVRWLLAHVGSGHLAVYLRVARDYPHVYLESSFSPCPRGLIERLVAEGLAHKLVWGTDQLLLNPAHQLGRVLFARIAPEHKRAILGANAARVFAAPG